MWNNIEKEKRSAEHLLYVSLKYTKTCDVILNLISRWQNMITESINALLEKAKKKKLIKSIPIAPKMKSDLVGKIFSKEPLVKEILEVYAFFKKIPQLEQFREYEFRKNVRLRVIMNNKDVEIDIEKLKFYQDLLERFLSFVRDYIK
ncbi:hypothetical protein HZA33_00495 [Candidatus Pacearchaeota archaeon]|nr:hypothetical protein [Candidatus Pacearchaeota archaeon]